MIFVLKKLSMSRSVWRWALIVLAVIVISLWVFSNAYDPFVQLGLRDTRLLPSVESVPLVGSITVYNGITVAQDTSHLVLANRALGGSLKAEVRFLTNLKELDLSGNTFTDVPAEIGQLSQLEVLNLANNKLTGLPHELGNLHNLRVLDVQGNDISSFDLDTIREQLGSGMIILE